MRFPTILCFVLAATLRTPFWRSVARISPSSSPSPSPTSSPTPFPSCSKCSASISTSPPSCRTRTPATTSSSRWTSPPGWSAERASWCGRGSCRRASGGASASTPPVGSTAGLRFSQIINIMLILVSGRCPAWCSPSSSSTTPPPWTALLPRQTSPPRTKNLLCWGHSGSLLFLDLYGIELQKFLKTFLCCIDCVGPCTADVTTTRLEIMVTKYLRMPYKSILSNQSFKLFCPDPAKRNQGPSHST